MLRFSDGMEIDTSGPYRVISKSDGMYVVGNGMCCPVRDGKEASKVLSELVQAQADKPANPHSHEIRDGRSNHVR